MKTKLNFLPGAILFLILVLLFSSCAKTEMVSLSDEFEGSLKLHVDLAVSIYDDVPATRAVDAGTFQVQIFKKNGSAPVATFEHASELPDSIALAEGEYYVEACYGTGTEAAFENPCYYGKS